MTRWVLIGKDGDLTAALPPHHRTFIRRFGGLNWRLMPQEGDCQGLEASIGEGASVPASPRRQASLLASRPDTSGVLPHGAVELRVSTPHYHPLGVRRITPPSMPSADFCAAVRSLYGSLSSELGTRRRPLGVGSVAFHAWLPDPCFASLVILISR